MPFSFCHGMLQWADAAVASEDFAHVQSFSWSEQCLENMCDSQIRTRLNQDLQKFAAMGITVLFASGDDGSGGAGPPQWGNGGKLSAAFPSDSPYVLSVGGTKFSDGLKGEEIAVDTYGSGGGFSYNYERPEWQKAQVEEYLKQDPLTGNGKYAQNGRATPDVSWLGESALVYAVDQKVGGDGTSLSTPMWAGLISRLNEVCLVASGGTKRLGMVNQLFYQHPEAFNDITKGTNAINYNKDSGWLCKKGWDAVTGLGSPNFQKLRAVVQNACSGGPVPPAPPSPKPTPSPKP